MPHVAIRPGVPQDYDAFQRLFAELEIPDPVPDPDRFAVSILPVMRVAVVNDGAVVGFVTWRSYGTTVHVMQLAVDRAVRGKRVGEALLEHVRAEARATGARDWYLNVKRENTAALKLYDRVGLRFQLESFAMKVPWASVPRAIVRERLAEPEEDAVIAAKFSLPVERVAMFRARGNFRLVALRADDDDAAILGFAAYDPHYPGAATFCAVRPDLAALLREAMRHHADEAFDYVRVSVEGDRALAEAVLALGAEMTFEILRLGAPL